MKKKLIFATGNKGKMKEIREILGDLDYEILSMKEAGVDVDIVEDGTTFEENAIIKAKTVMEATGSLVLADDSGLEVDYLNKDPQKVWFLSRITGISMLLQPEHPMYPVLHLPFPILEWLSH